MNGYASIDNIFGFSPVAPPAIQGPVGAYPASATVNAAPVTANMAGSAGGETGLSIPLWFTVLVGLLVAARVLYESGAELD